MVQAEYITTAPPPSGAVKINAVLAPAVASVPVVISTALNPMVLVTTQTENQAA
jgi:CBS-domain-containing membrane protein